MMIRCAGIETPAISMLVYHPHRSPRVAHWPHDRASIVSAGRMLSGTTPVSPMTLYLMHPRVRDQEAGAAVERCAR